MGCAVAHLPNTIAKNASDALAGSGTGKINICPENAATGGSSTVDKTCPVIALMRFR